MSRRKKFIPGVLLVPALMFVLSRPALSDTPAHNTLPPVSGKSAEPASINGAEPAPDATAGAALTTDEFQQGKNAYDHKDWHTAIAKLRPLAENGDDRAMILLGNMYNDGMGVIQNHLEAINLYKKAATKKNSTQAMVAVAAMYTSGIGVDQNLNTAMKWFERAGRMGDQTGAFFYATILLRGNKSATDEIPSNPSEAYKWYVIASHEKQSAKIATLSGKLAGRLAEKKLAAADVTKADLEAAHWQPADPASLGPFPEDPAPAPAAIKPATPAAEKPAATPTAVTPPSVQKKP